MASDVNPRTLFWIQGRFVPVTNPSLQGDAEVETIFCSGPELECLDVDSSNPFPRTEQVWIQEFRIVDWGNGGILATSRSLEGCTDETLKIDFAPPSVVMMNSPTLPL